MSERTVDRDYLTRIQYASDKNLAARQSIYRFQQPRRPTAPFALGLVDLTGDERILDAGCGNGLALAELRRRAHRGPVFGLDLSPGMRPHLVGDVQRLPFPDGSFDLVLAMHMLYHVPSIPTALAEFRRVLRPGAPLIALTNAADHLEELNEVLGISGARAFTRFGCENAAGYLRASFDSVEEHDASSELVVTELPPLVDYVQSMKLPDQRIEEFAAAAGAIIERDGAFRIRTRVCCFVCC